MDIKNNRQNSLDNVFNQRWKANNYNYNGVKDVISDKQKHFDRMFNIKSKEEKREEILKANSVDGRVNRLNEQMNSVFTNRNTFK